MSTAGVTILEAEVRELIRRRGIDPLRDRAGVDQLVADALADYDTPSALGAVPPLADPPSAVRAVLDAVAATSSSTSTTPTSRRSGSTRPPRSSSLATAPPS